MCISSFVHVHDVCPDICAKTRPAHYKLNTLEEYGTIAWGGLRYRFFNKTSLWAKLEHFENSRISRSHVMRNSCSQSCHVLLQQRGALRHRICFTSCSRHGDMLLSYVSTLPCYLGAGRAHIPNTLQSKRSCIPVHGRV